MYCACMYVPLAMRISVVELTHKLPRPPPGGVVTDTRENPVYMVLPAPLTLIVPYEGDAL